MNRTTFFRLTCTALLAGAIFTPGKIVAALGDLYTLSPNHAQILRVAADGTKTPFATFGNATNFLAFDRAGNLYASESTTDAVVKITPSGSKSTIASAFNVDGLAVDAAGNVFVADFTTHTIVKVTPAGAKSTFAAGFDPQDLVFDGAGNLYTLDDTPGSAARGKIYKFAPDGTKTILGTGPTHGYRIAFDYSGNFYVASLDGVIVKFAPGGAQSTLASGLGGLTGLACDALGNVLAVDFAASTLIKIAPGGMKTTFATGVGGGLIIEPPRGNSLNIATRLNVLTGENVLIGGFIITDTGGKSVVIRGIGPSLGAAGVQDPLQDPIIELHYPGGFVNTNDNWKDTQATQIQGTALAPTDDREAALTYNLPPGNYTVVMRGKNNGTGVGLIEVYDIQPSSGKLANISTRGQVGTGGSVMIGGFILGGNGARVLVRAIGPSLANFGITGTLADPQLSLRNGNGTQIGLNDDWDVAMGGDPHPDQIRATGLAPSSNRESAIIVDLPNGNYTAIVQGYNGGTGVGLVEVYNLN